MTKENAEAVSDQSDQSDQSESENILPVEDSTADDAILENTPVPETSEEKVEKTEKVAEAAEVEKAEVAEKAEAAEKEKRAAKKLPKKKVNCVGVVLCFHWGRYPVVEHCWNGDCSAYRGKKCL